MKKHLPFLFILLLAFLLRIYQFGDIPYGVNRDEAALGYNAYSILKTAKDEYGRILPLRFESFGDWKQPFYVYLATIPVSIGGLTEQSVRFPALIASLVMIIATYMLARIIAFKPLNPTSVSISAAIFLALNPWHFRLSRIAVEALVAATLLSCAVVLLLSSKPTKPTNILGLFLLIFSLFTYHGALITIPLIFAIFWIQNYKKLRKRKEVIVLSLVLIAIVAVLFKNTFLSAEKVKAQGLVIFDLSNKEKYEQIYSKRDSSLVSTVVNNQYTYFARNLAINYSQSFSLDFLLNKGSGHPNYDIEGFGNFILPEVLFALIGIVYLIKSKKTHAKLLLGWLLVAPLAGAVTRDAVSSTREIFLLPVVQLTAAIGFTWFVSIIKLSLKPALFILGISLVVFSTPFYKFYFQKYQAQSDDSFHGYLKDVSYSIDSNYNKYSNIYVTFPYESPYIFYSFYNQIDPSSLQQYIIHYPLDREGFRHVKKLGNINFSSRKPTEIKSPENNLVYSRYQEIPEWITPLKIWHNLEGEEEIIAWEEMRLK